MKTLVSVLFDLRIITCEKQEGSIASPNAKPTPSDRKPAPMDCNETH
jgi:hypothetical protein